MRIRLDYGTLACSPLAYLQFRDWTNLRHRLWVDADWKEHLPHYREVARIKVERVLEHLHAQPYARLPKCRGPPETRHHPSDATRVGSSAPLGSLERLADAMVEKTMHLAWDLRAEQALQEAGGARRRTQRNYGCDILKYVPLLSYRALTWMPTQAFVVLSAVRLCYAAGLARLCGLPVSHRIRDHAAWNYGQQLKHLWLETRSPGYPGDVELMEKWLRALKILDLARWDRVYRTEIRADHT